MTDERLQELLKDENPHLSPRNSMVFWYPRIQHLFETPTTGIVRVEFKDTFEWMDNGKVPQEILDQVTEKADKVGYPFFMRTDQLSGKHDYVETCLVLEKKDIERHILELIMTSQCAGFLGLPVYAFVIREFIHIKHEFTAFRGRLPIGCEVRLFLRDGEVECFHFYWPKDAIRKPSIPDWEVALEQMRDYCEGQGIKDILEENQEVFKELNELLGGGYWSIDFAQTFEPENKWYMIDMALGDASYHPDCPLKPKVEEHPLPASLFNDILKEAKE